MIAFLKKLQEELNTEKINKNEDYELILSKIKENEKFIQLLQEESDSVFSDFTPRNVNHKNESKIEEINRILDNLKTEKDKTEAELNHIQNKLDEIQQILCDNSLAFSETDEQLENKTDKNHCDDMFGYMMERLSYIDSFIVNDPLRAKVEIHHIIEEIKKKTLQSDNEEGSLKPSE